MSDPTYVTSIIEKDPVWKLAFIMSEIHNDNAPVDWGSYISLAAILLAKYNIQEKE